MNDHTDTLLEVKQQETTAKSESPFYPGIAKNRLYFHGTNSQFRLTSIIESGLKPPDSTVSDNTLARRISFCDFARYVGFDGAILGFKPEIDEVEEMSPLYARETSINNNLPKLPAERAVFYLPGNTRLARQIFEGIRQVVTDFYQTDQNNNFLLLSLKDWIEKINQGLQKEATLLNKTTSEGVYQLAQEIVWNELAGYTTLTFDELGFYAREISTLRKTREFVTREQLEDVIKKTISFSHFEVEVFLNNFRFLENIGNIDGLGFEGLTYPIDNSVKNIQEWLLLLPSEKQIRLNNEQQKTSSKIDRIRHWLKKMAS